MPTNLSPFLLSYLHQSPETETATGGKNKKGNRKRAAEVRMTKMKSLRTSLTMSTSQRTVASRLSVYRWNSYQSMHASQVYFHLHKISEKERKEPTSYSINMNLISNIIINYNRYCYDDTTPYVRLCISYRSSRLADTNNSSACAIIALEANKPGCRRYSNNCMIVAFACSADSIAAG